MLVFQGTIRACCSQPQSGIVTRSIIDPTITIAAILQQAITTKFRAIHVKTKTAKATQFLRS